MDLIDVEPPYCLYAERAALGAAVLKAEDMTWLRQYTKRARGRDFYDCLHGWTWDRLRWYANKGRPPLVKWWEADGVFRKYEEVFEPRANERLPLLILQWINTDFWWNADYYLDVVLEMSKARARLVKATECLKGALEDGTALRDEYKARYR